MSIDFVKRDRERAEWLASLATGNKVAIVSHYWGKVSVRDGVVSRITKTLFVVRSDGRFHLHPNGAGVQCEQEEQYRRRDGQEPGVPQYSGGSEIHSPDSEEVKEWRAQQEASRLKGKIYEWVGYVPSDRKSIDGLFQAWSLIRALIPRCKKCGALLKEGAIEAKHACEAKEKP